jgi:hypothetical protein
MGLEPISQYSCFLTVLPRLCVCVCVTAVVFPKWLLLTDLSNIIAVTQYRVPQNEVRHQGRVGCGRGGSYRKFGTQPIETFCEFYDPESYRRAHKTTTRPCPEHVQSRPQNQTYFPKTYFNIIFQFHYISNASFFLLTATKCMLHGKISSVSLRNGLNNIT